MGLTLHEKHAQKTGHVRGGRVLAKLWKGLFWAETVTCCWVTFRLNLGANLGLISGLELGHDLD